MEFVGVTWVGVNMPAILRGCWCSLIRYVRNAQIEGDVLKERGDAAVEERTIRVRSHYS